MGSPARQSLHFEVDGGYLTELARNLVLESQWEKALRILKDGLQGISTDQVIAILVGDFELDGVNTVRYLRKEDLEYKNKVHKLYAGYIRSLSPKGERWYRPEALVTDYGPMDRKGLDESGGSNDGEFNVFGRYHRALHYSFNRKTDLTAMVKVPGEYEDAGADGTMAVLFSQVEPPPFWLSDEILKRNTTPQRSLNEFLKFGNKLEERGHDERYPDQYNDEREERVQKALYSTLQKSIAKKAGDSWIEIAVGDKTIKVPKAPFEHWCLSRSSGRHLASPWEPVSTSGMKLPNDDPYHTDWMIGAGLPLDAMSDEKLSDAVYKARFKLVEAKLGHQCTVLSGQGSTGRKKVIHPDADAKIAEDAIIVLPSASPKFLPLVAQIKTGAVIVEKGGSVAHLVNVAREREVKIVRVENAKKLYPEGTLVSVDCQNGKVEIK
jgi:phosphohistidine swiveling domain-containing protein